MLKDDDENNEDEEDEMKENNSKWKRMKRKSKKNYQLQEKHVKKQRHESEVEMIEDGGAYEDELKQSKEMHEIARKYHDRLSKESADVEKRYEELVEKLKKDIVSCVMNDELEGIEPEEIRKGVDSKFVLNVRDEHACESEEDYLESEDETEDEEK